MCQPAGSPRQIHQPPRPEEGAFLIPPFHMRAVGVALLVQVLPTLQPILVLAVEGDPALPGEHHLLKRGIVLDEEVARRAPCEYLDAANAPFRLQASQQIDIGLRSSYVET